MGDSTSEGRIIIIDILEAMLSDQKTGLLLLRLAGNITCVHISEMGADMLSLSPFNGEADFNKLSSSLREKDYVTLENVIIRSAETFCCDSVPCKKTDGKWLQMRVLPVSREQDGHTVMAVAISETSENIESLERKLKDKKADLTQNTVRPVTFEIDAATHTVALSDQFRLLFDACDTILWSAEDCAPGHPCTVRDIRPVCQETYREIHSGKQEGLFPLRLRSRLTGFFLQTTVFWKIIFDDHGRAERLVGIVKLGKKKRSGANAALISNLQLQLQLQDAYLRHTSEYLQELRRYRHDRSNHIIALQAFLQRGDTIGALEYLSGLGDSLKSEAPIIDTGNPAIDAVITEKLTAAKKLGVSVLHTVGIHPGVKMDMMDLTTVAGNCLDNAVEACGRVIAAGQQAFIELKFVEQHGALVFQMRNSSLPLADPGTELPETTKPDKENHGLGLQNVQRIIKKYSGKLIVTPEQNVFTTSFTLFLP